MTTESKSYLRLWLIAVLAVGVLRLLAGCARPQETIVELTPWSSCDHAQYCQIGQVVCSNHNQPVMVLRKGISPEDMPYTLLHERTHERQMAKDCEGTRQRFRNDSTFRFKMELEAYCNEAKARVLKGNPIEGVMGGLTSLLQALYDVNEEDVVCDWSKLPRG